VGSNPTYYKGRLYVGGGRVEALDAATGKQLWRKSGYAPYKGLFHCLTVTEGRIYCGRIAGHNGKKTYFACALDAEDGKEVWSTPLVEVVPNPGAKPHDLGPGIGRIAVGGGLALVTPHILGTGYEGITNAVLGQGTWYFLLGLAGLKLLATSFTLGSGGSGGIFAPALFIGAMAGGA